MEHAIEHDHRQLGQELDLFHFREEAPGMAFWHPRGLAIVQALEQASRDVCRHQGYEEIRSPQLLRRHVWEASGHWQHFADAMFRVEDQKCDAALKPVSCPGFLLIQKRSLLSYRDLPLRRCELGVVHRDEASGALHGLLRARQFVQDDGHILCEPDQAEEEVLRFARVVPRFYAAFGLGPPKLALSLRPEHRAGDDASWDHAEAVLRGAAERIGGPFALQPGAGAFYGPKLEWSLEDRHGRAWQCGTIQVDLHMPRSFELRYVAASGAREHPIMLHRALYGSLERFLGMLLEHHGRHLPAWLLPMQVAVLPVDAAQSPAAEAIRGRLAAAGVRARVDEGESLSKRIALAHERAIPFVIVVGAREVAAGEGALRSVGEPQRSLPVAELAAELARRVARPPLWDDP